MDFSPNVRSRSALSGKNFFKMEMKSTSFLDYLDADETNAARNILQTEVMLWLFFPLLHMLAKKL